MPARQQRGARRQRAGEIGSAAAARRNLLPAGRAEARLEAAGDRLVGEQRVEIHRRRRHAHPLHRLAPNRSGRLVAQSVGLRTGDHRFSGDGRRAEGRVPLIVFTSAVTPPEAGSRQSTTKALHVRLRLQRQNLPSSGRGNGTVLTQQPSRLRMCSPKNTVPSACLPVSQGRAGSSRHGQAEPRAGYVTAQVRRCVFQP